jgi:hypothetical protein
LQMIVTLAEVSPIASAMSLRDIAPCRFKI